MKKFKALCFSTLLAMNCYGDNSKCNLDEGNYDLYLRILNDEANVLREINDNKNALEQEQWAVVKKSFKWGGIIGAGVGVTMVSMVAASSLIPRLNFVNVCPAWLIEKLNFSDVNIYTRVGSCLLPIIFSSITMAFCAAGLSKYSFSAESSYYDRLAILKRRLNAISDYRVNYMEDVFKEKKESINAVVKIKA